MGKIQISQSYFGKCLIGFLIGVVASIAATYLWETVIQQFFR